MNKKQTEQHIMSLITSAEQWRDNNYKKLWNDCYRRWRSIPDKKREGSNIFVPYSFMIHNVISSRCTESLFANRPAVSVLPRKEGMDDGAGKMQSLLDWLFTEKMQLPRLFSEQIVSSMCIYGTVVTHTAWKKEVKQVKTVSVVETDLLDDMGNRIIDNVTGEVLHTRERVVEPREKVVYDDPYTQFVDLLDFFVDPLASGLQDARYCGHKEYRTLADLKKHKDRGWKINFKELTPASNINTGQQERYEQSGVSSDEPQTDSNKDPNGMYLVYHFWELNKHYVMVGNQLVLEEDNPYNHGELPYDMCRYMTLPQEFYGMGIMELLGGLQDELNTFRNQRIDYNSMALRRMWKLRKGCGLTAKDLVWRQNGVVQVENMDDVLEIPVQPLPASAFSNEMNIKQDMKDATGCHDILMGIAQQDETATTTMTKDNNASIRFKEIVRSLADDLIVPIAQKCVALEQQYMSTEKSLRIDDSDIENRGITIINPFSITGDFDLIYVGTAVDPLANKQSQQKNLLQIMQIAQGMPLYQQSPDALIEIMRKFLESCDLKDIESMLPTLPPPVPAGVPGGVPGMPPAAPGMPPKGVI